MSLYALDDDQQPILEPSLVLFVDILGYSAMATDIEALTRLRRALAEHKGVIADPAFSSGWVERFEAKTFTDNIVVGFPIRDDGESEFGSILHRTADYQLRLMLEGFFVRGGLGFGPHFMDEHVVIGPALIDAYQAESKLAVVPRVVLTTDAVLLCEKHVGYYGHESYAPQNRDLLRDADGQVFINYLAAAMPATRDEIGEEFDEVMLHHRSVIEEKLAEHVSSPRVWEKFAWVGRYHNHVMPSLVGKVDAPDFMIDVDKLIPKFDVFVKASE